MKTALAALTLLLAPHGAFASDFFSLGLPQGFAADFLPFPVFMCAGNYQPEKRLGITLHRQQF